MRFPGIFIVVGVVLAYSLPAEGAPRSFTVKNKIDTLRVSLAPEKPVVLMFKSELVEWVPDARWKVAVDVKQALSTVELYAPRGIKPAQVGGTLIVATRAYTLYVQVDAAPPGAGDDTVSVEHIELVSLCNARERIELDARVKQAVSEKTAEFSRELARERERHTQAMQEKDLANAIVADQAMLDQVTDRLEEIPLEAIPCVKGGISVCEPKLMLMGDGAILRFTALNNSPYEAPVANVRVIGLDGENLVTSTNMEERNESPRRSSAIGVIPPGGSAVTSVKLRDPERLGLSFNVVLAGNSGALPVKQPVHLMDRMQQQAEERRRRYLEQREAERVSLHLVGTIGAIWLPSGISGDDTLEAASLTGAGVRFTKGLYPLIAVEGEIAGAASGTADYGTVVVDGVEGQLSRSANLARAQFGGVLRFGDKFVPILRAGLGLQVVSQDSVLMTAGGGMDGPDAGIEVGMGLYMGAGMDIKLGSNWIVGAGVSFAASQRNGGILDIAVNLAYRWDAAE